MEGLRGATGGALAPLPALPAKHMAGPTPFSNWVIPGQVIAGAYPASMDDQETERLLTLLLELGINTFVCLQAEVNIHIPEHAWRAGMGLRPYIKDAQRILSRAHETNSMQIKQRKIDFLHLPIIDGSVTTDTAMGRLADDCCERVLRGEKMYIHCWGGHGRTGTLVATMLGRLYNLPYSTALRYTQGYHDTRMYPQGVRSPQTAVQRAQVRRLLLLPSPVPAMVLSGSAPAAANITADSSSPSKNNIALGNKSTGNSFKEPTTPTRAAGLSSPLTPVKQGARSASQPSTPKSAAAAASSPFNWTPPTPGSRVSAPAGIGVPANISSSSSSTLFSSTAACRGSPSSVSKRAAASAAPGQQQQQYSSSSSCIACPDSSNAVAVAGLLKNGSLLQQHAAESSKQQQWLAGTAMVSGSPLASAAAAVRASSSSSALLRAAGPRTPVQTRMTSSLSSKAMLVKRALDMQA